MRSMGSELLIPNVKKIGHWADKILKEITEGPLKNERGHRRHLKSLKMWQGSPRNNMEKCKLVFVMNFESLLDLYDEFHGEIIRGIDAIGCAGHVNNKTFSYDYINFIFDDKCLCFTVDIDTDQILISKKDYIENIHIVEHPVNALQRMVGKDLGWAWFARNSNGYSDMVILSSSGIVPELALVGEASGITLYSLEMQKNLVDGAIDGAMVN